MKSAWRQRLSSALIGCGSVGCVIAFSGCQTWSPSSWGVPTSTRVPAPPTGSVQPQGAYYNNGPMGTPAAPVKATTQVKPNVSAPVVQASAVNPFGSNGSMQATNLSDNSGAFSSVTTAVGSKQIGDSKAFGGQVSTAGYTDNGSGMAQVVSAGSLQATGNHSSDAAMGSTSSVGDGANLQWTSK